MTDWAVLAGLEPGERERVLRAGRSRCFGRGEVILRAGDPASCLHLLGLGRVSIRVPAADGDEVIVAVLGPGSLVGEQAAVAAEGEWATSVVAMERCQTICFHHAQLRAIMQSFPAIATYLLASLTAQLAQARDRLAEMAYVPTTRRLQRRLLDLHAEYGAEDIPVTQNDLAMMAGATRSTVNAIISDLDRRGVVRKRRGHLRILDVSALVRTSGAFG